MDAALLLYYAFWFLGNYYFNLYNKFASMEAGGFAGGMLVITNYTGHPQLAFRSGFSDQASRTIFGGAQEEGERPTFRVPQTTSLWAPLFEEGRIIALGREIERRLGVADERPSEFA